MSDEAAQVVAADVTRLAAMMHAVTADFARRAAEFDDSGGWRGVGFQSCAHWLSIHAGLEVWTAASLLRVGHALRGLPKIGDAFAAGQLSFDKVRALVSVAQPGDEHVWLDIGLQGSGSQVGRICRAFRRAVETDDPDRAAAQQRKRRLVTWWRDDGMLEVFATLPPEDGSVVVNALRAAMAPPGADGVAPERFDADNPVAARRADAFVDICRRWIALKAAETSPADAPRSLVVHVDADVLMNGTTSDGRCHVEDGPALPAAVAARLGCDADVLAVVERNGVPIATGCTRRVVPRRMRTLVRLRDETCRYPGCTVPARNTEAHHVQHWAHGGQTEVSNLVCLCEFHHHRHHDGEFEIRVVEDGGFEFVTAEGIPIADRRAAASPAVMAAIHKTWDELRASEAMSRVSSDAPIAGGRGERFDMEHTMWTLGQHRDAALQGVGPAP